jgi:hypothetical protein
MTDEALGLKEYAQALIDFVGKCDTPMTIETKFGFAKNQFQLQS